MIEQIIHVLKFRQAEIRESMGQGQPASWDSYQRMVGEMQGVTFALTMIDNLLKEDEIREI